MGVGNRECVESVWSGRSGRMCRIWNFCLVLCGDAFPILLDRPLCLCVMGTLAHGSMLLTKHSGMSL